MPLNIDIAFQWFKKKQSKTPKQSSSSSTTTESLLKKNECSKFEFHLIKIFFIQNF